MKVYRSEKTATDEGWRHARITLEPDTTAEGYEPIVIDPDDAGDVRIVAELAEVLPSGS